MLVGLPVALAESPLSGTWQGLVKQFSGISAENLSERQRLQASQCCAHRKHVLIREVCADVLEAAGRIRRVVLGILTCDELQLHGGSDDFLLHDIVSFRMFLAAPFPAATISYVRDMSLTTGFDKMFLQVLADFPKMFYVRLPQSKLT